VSVGNVIVTGLLKSSHFIGLGGGGSLKRVNRTHSLYRIPRRMLFTPPSYSSWRILNPI